ncbi:hypothetical protein Pint_26535 [Pistacia integerrima]|uniref:Uncharacterized protein n=1 Tax=Pistacia integerrima TaxID=434235 RepID=A0ACC0YW44_9ROSI|nr:hypothetical protein Pint_26535 [Pistacia integerrima]
MKKLHLFFISTPGIGNLVPLVEFAQLVTQHHPRFTATILTITVPERPIVNAYINSRGASLAADRHLHDVNFLHLPPVGPLSPDEYQSSLGEGSDLVSAEELEKGLGSLMKGDSEVRRKVKEMQEKSRRSLMENGSSYKSLKSLIDELLVNI